MKVKRVIVLHGLYMSGLVMRPLCSRLEESGVKVLNLTYNTRDPNRDAIFTQIKQVQWSRVESFGGRQKVFDKCFFAHNSLLIIRICGLKFRKTLAFLAKVPLQYVIYSPSFLSE